MTRQMPSWKLQQRADQAKAREAYYASRNTSEDTFNSTVESRPRIRVGYRSLNRKTGATPIHAVLSIPASEQAVKWFEGVADTANLGDGNLRLGLEYADLTDFLPIEGFQTSKIHATLGATTPVPVRTAWGTRYIKYTANADGNSRGSYTAPICVKTGAFTAAQLATAAQTIANIATIKAAIKENGRMWFEPEAEDYVLNTD